MKVFGVILLLLGVLSVVSAFKAEPPRHRSEAYQTGYRAGRVVAPVVFFGLGSWLLFRDRTRRPRPTSSDSISRRYSGVPPRTSPSPAPPPLPASPQIPVKIQCACGQNYSFEVEPVGGRMPAQIACPTCGADGTETANAYIAGVLAARAQAPVAPFTTVFPQRRRKLHPVLLGLVIVMGILVMALVLSVAYRVVSRGSRSAPPPPRRTADPSWTRQDGAPPSTAPSSPASRPPGAANERISPSAGRPGSAREAAPVPAGVTAVEVYWGNRWWPATILRREDSRAFIHYEGWGSSSDEWVTPDRMRPRR